MRRFVITFLVFFISFFIFDKIFYVFLYHSPSLEKDRRLEDVLLGDMNKDIIVFGSSRGARNIIASQIEDSLGRSVYNLSYPGANIEFHEFLLRSLLKFNRAPSLVVLAVDDDFEVIFEKSSKFRLDRLYPLSKYNYINEELIKRGEKNILSKFMVLARLNKSNFQIKKKSFNLVDTISYSGSMPIDTRKKTARFKYGVKDREYDTLNELPALVNAFKNFQKICIENSIQLLIVYPPNYKSHNLALENRLKDLSNDEAEHWVYDTNRVEYQDSLFFYDESHLRYNGAVLFTSDLVRRIKKEF